MHTTAHVLSLGESVEALLLSKQVGGLSTRTLDAYRAWLGQFVQSGGTPDALAVQRFFTGLRERGLKPSSLHTAYRTLKTFFRWAVDCGLLPDQQGDWKGEFSSKPGRSWPVDPEMGGGDKQSRQGQRLRGGRSDGTPGV